jgi:hypothetical protein
MVSFMPLLYAAILTYDACDGSEADALLMREAPCKSRRVAQFSISLGSRIRPIPHCDVHPIDSIQHCQSMPAAGKRAMRLLRELFLSSSYAVKLLNPDNLDGFSTGNALWPAAFPLPSRALLCHTQ